MPITQFHLAYHWVRVRVGQEAATGMLSAAERSHPMSKVRGRSREDPMPEGQWPRGVTPCPRSGAAAESTRLRLRRNDREELPSIGGQRGRPRGDTQHPRSGAVTRGVIPRPRSGVATRGVTLRPRSGAAAGRRYPMPKARGQGWWAGGATPCPHAPMSEARGVARRSNPTPIPGVMAGRTNPTSKEPWLHGRRRA